MAQALAAAAATVAQRPALVDLAVEPGEERVDHVPRTARLDELADAGDAQDVPLQPLDDLLRGAGEHLDDHAARRGDAGRPGEDAQEHRRVALLALRQVVGDVFADLAAHQLHLAVVAAAAGVLAEHPQQPLAHRAADGELAVRVVGHRHPRVAHHAAQVALRIGFGDHAPERPIAADLDDQPRRRLGREAQQQRGAGEAAAEGRRGDRREVEPAARLLDDAGDVGDGPAQSAAAGEPELQRARGAVLWIAVAVVQGFHVVARSSSVSACGTRRRGGPIPGDRGNPAASKRAPRPPT